MKQNLGMRLKPVDRNPIQILFSNSAKRKKLSSFFVEKFLIKIGLSHLYEFFKEEEVTMDLLANFKEINLINVGIKKYGNRLKILNGIKDLDKSGMFK